ncbi:DnaQ-like DNA polymerase III subunit [Mycobacterium phage Bricole]|uniref:DnaQ-like DNA polymerase III subunit n=2 Tax=Bongovirus bongo TaxID=1983750 RepID=A0A0M4QUF1_9CAUD|nr:DNA polymerase exonuclease subunit [Mycobacterium phage PegLeg]AGM12327.1 DnaQ-like DNA polymerase III subunit [Mycobacterium phage PegLeg]ALF00606.1 DnaQ-like DNA polymerase III subunit [Mycobacterium phage Bricole]
MSAKILVLDIERQSALVDGVWEGKQYSTWVDPSRVIEPARTICFAYRWLHEDKTKFVAEWDGGLPQDNTAHTPGGGHKRMVEKARELFDEADYIVGFNSKNFDVKYLRADMWLYDLSQPAPHVDIDLMQQATKNFKLYAKSMKYLAKAKAMEGKEQTELGLWRKLRFADGDVLRRAQRAMKKYNIRDVDQTLELFYDMRGWLSGMNLALYEDDIGPFCPNCASANLQYRGWAGNRTYKYRRFQCTDCGKWGRDAKSFASVQSIGIP